MLPVIWHEAYEVDIGPHVFPTQKYRLVRQRLLEEGVIARADILCPEPVTDDDMALVHSRDFLHKINTGGLSLTEQSILEVPFSPDLHRAMWLCTGGSLLTARSALDRSVAVHLGGGFHHAFPDHGEGFCLINDVAVAIRMLQRERTVERAAVIDCDVHHGNGTAAIFADDSTVFTFSMHQQHNYPAWKPHSDLDLGLEDGTTDKDYLELLDQHLPTVLRNHRPDVVFYLAGADPYQGDQLGGLHLTLEGLRRRDQLALTCAHSEGIPVAVVLAGGYAFNQNDTIEIHCNTVREARATLREPDQPGD